MQFFEHQDQARGRTTLLLVLFAIAVLGLGLLSALFTHFALNLGRDADGPAFPFEAQLVSCAAIATWGLILLGSAHKLSSLRSGGRGVAEALGGRLLAANTTDHEERRLLNIVQEMAIAASLPVPPVYLLGTEKGINAFSAGWAIDDAIIGVTQGALVHLNRDQLQGVIAHEFSHLLNRDCALNMRLLGVLHGIVVISSLGRVLMSMGTGSRHRSTRLEGGDAGFYLVGGAIWLFGSLGELVARLIQSAVSQEREYLADASAVQFTRNPWGISGALAKIGCESSSLVTPQAPNSSHMFISSPASSAFAGLLASHPPLFERISRLLPGWDGQFATLANKHEALEIIDLPELGQTSQFATLHEVSPTQTQAPHLLAAADLIASVDPLLRQAAADPFSARALLIRWVLDDEPKAQARQQLELARDPALQAELKRLDEAFRLLPLALQLPLVDLALGTMAELSDQQDQDFSQLVHRLKDALSPRAYRAYCLASLTLRRLNSALPQPKQPMLIKTAIEVTIAVLASCGHESAELAEQAYFSGCSQLKRGNSSLRLPEPDALNVQSLDRALFAIQRLPIKTQKELLRVAEAVAGYDGVLHPSEVELLRLIAATLHLAQPMAEHSQCPSADGASLIQPDRPNSIA